MLSGNDDSDLSPYRYAGREYEGNGLYYNRARYYDAGAARFISADPVGIFPGHTNLYAYADNNPVHASDPDGRFAFLIIPAVYGAIEVGLSLYDAYDTVSTIIDPCTSSGEKWVAGGLAVAGVFLPGGGYSAADDIARGVAKGAANPKVKAAAARGREAHKEFANKVKAKNGWQSEPQNLIDPVTGKKVIPDAVTPSGRPLELKPNTPSGRRQGRGQLRKYERATGKKGKVVYYDP